MYNILLAISGQVAILPSLWQIYKEISVSIWNLQPGENAAIV